MAGKHRRDVALHSFLLPYLFPRVVWVVYLVGLDAKHYTGCLHGQLHAIRRLPETFNLVERKRSKHGGRHVELPASGKACLGFEGNPVAFK